MHLKGGSLRTRVCENDLLAVSEDEICAGRAESTEVVGDGKKRAARRRGRRRAWRQSADTDLATDACVVGGTILVNHFPFS
jgi:hypothetical protein